MTYIYKAQSYDGNFVSGSIEAENKSEAAAKIRSKKLIVKNIKPLTAVSKDIVLFTPKVNKKELVFMLKNMSTMLKAGIPIMQALDIMEDQIKQRVFRNAIKTMRTDLTNGLLLSESMIGCKIFPDLVPAIIRIGEESGNLDKSFLQLSQYYMKSIKTKGKVIGALTYPVLTFVFSIIAIWFLTSNVLPTIIDALPKGTELSGLTKFLISVSHFMRTYNLLPLLIFFGIIFIIVVLGKTIFKKQKDWILLKIPLYGKLIKKSKVIQFTTTLSILTEAGVTITKSLDIISHIIGNEVYRSNIKKVKGGVVNGELISANLSLNLFDKLVVTIISIGESTGDMQKPLEDIADYLNEELDSYVARLVELITPITILFIAALVGTIVIGVMEPMFSIYK